MPQDPSVPAHNCPRAPKPPRIYQRSIEKLTRVVQGDCGRTLHFTIPRSTKSRRSNVSFIDVENVPAEARDATWREAWFEVEKVEGHPWNFWRAVRQVEPHNARA
ncbi:MAG: hypothetical protein J7521_20505 [Caulobacter sp.]|nr:hypothetical protein [Caulobacter sp.]